MLLAGGAQDAGTAVEGAEDDGAQAARDVDAIESGRPMWWWASMPPGVPPYVLAAVAGARERGARTVGIADVPRSALAAGTTQKMAPNTISTAAMVRCGATYGPWMVDLRATNAKLRRRAVRIVGDAAGLSEAQAEQTLADADRSVNVALVMKLGRLAADQARDRLAAAGSVRRALSERDDVHRSRDDAVSRDGGLR